MGKHAQSRSRYTAWSHSRLFPARESGGGCEPKWAVACVTVYLFGMLSSYVSSTWYHGSVRVS